MENEMASIVSLLEQAESGYPERTDRVHYTIGVIQGFLFLLSLSSQLTASQREQLKSIIKAWDDTLYSSSIQESEG